MNRIAKWFWRSVDNVVYNWNCNRRRFWLKIVVALGIVSSGCVLQFGEPFGPKVESDIQVAWIHLAWLVVSIGLSYLAGQLLAEKSDSPIRNDKPTTLSIRGSYIPWFVGIRRVGPVFAWAGDREIRKEKADGGGKGLGDPPEVDVPYEAAWHLLGVGPCYALHRIIQQGKVIFDGPITADSHPSGSVVDLGEQGSFSIFWGEKTQPRNAFLKNSNRVSIDSRWPNVCYVVWNKKRIAGGAWPILDYVVERRPSTTILTQSQGWYEPGITLTGSTDAVVAAVASANPDIGYLLIDGDKVSKYRPLDQIDVQGTGLTNGQYEVRRTEILLTAVVPLDPFTIYTTETKIFIQGGTLGVTPAGTGTIQDYMSDETDGANIAHVMAELLFADFPLGLQKDPNHLVETWDLPSLEALGVEAESKAWRAAVLGTEGETAEALLGAMLQDHGTMMPIDTASGNMLFQRVREPVGTLPSLGAEIYAERVPEIETVQGEQPVDRLIFSFSDREQAYGDMTIAIDEDGQAAFAEHQRARKVPIVSTTLFATAASLAELRSPEELAPGVQFRLDASRESRDLIPGQSITAPALGQVLLVLGVEVDPLSERVSLKVSPNFYGVPLSSFIVTPGAPEPTLVAPEHDEVFAWVEVPEQLLATTFPARQVILVPRIRAHDTISFASIYLSRDDVTYDLKVNDTSVQTGGTLDAEFAAGKSYLANGPVFTELGPDNSDAQDLSADLTSWGLGRQLAVIVSSAGTEICLVQKTTIVSGTQRRLDGLLRGCYGTRQLTHPVGAPVFIINASSFTEVTDSLLEPAMDLFVKTQPGTTAGQANLSSVGPYGQNLVGKGQVPIKPSYLHVRAPYLNSPSYGTGDDVTVSWAVSTGTKGTGAGGQSAGTPVGTPVIPGTLSLELLTTLNVVVDTIAVDPNTASEYVFTSAALIAALGSEVSFNVRITHVANGFVSPVSDTLTITKI